MRLEELLNVMDETENIDIWVDTAADINVQTSKNLFDRAEVSDVKASPEYEMLKRFYVWFVGRTFDESIEIRVCILKKDKSE